MRKLVSVFLFAASGAALAAATTAMPFKSVDADRDGYISAEEAKAIEGLAARFEQADTNRDGKLDRTEYEAITAAAEGAGQQR